MLSLGFLELARVTESAQQQPRKVTASSGRSVEIRGRISRVLAAGSPASIRLYTPASENMIGRVRVLSGGSRGAATRPGNSTPKGAMP